MNDDSATQSAIPLRIGFIGAGRLATTLAMVWNAQDAASISVFSRTRQSAVALASRCGAARVIDSAQELVDSADLVFITVPDDAIAGIANALQWRSGQSVVHCSAACEVDLLQVATHFGASIGGFHPLQIFSDPEVAQRLVAGSAVAIEASGNLQQTLNGLAAAAEMTVLSLKPGSRMAYHLAGNLAASCLLALLEEAENLWEEAGLDRDTALAALLPLSLGTLQTARSVGLAKAVSGPVSRGDTQVLQRHLALAKSRPAGDILYRELLVRLVTLAGKSQRLYRQQLMNLLEITGTGSQ